ncbi:MAG: hypothetical protein EZS28_022407 [Streblomastix strix]|uniref:Uncharacterized protein n=1 Tax=Streblomastix strix TaxID=222440 RepID=A0A5J4VHH6_9EUKA|nr:MAG: hypothetical protein EZS28_022407 [Streblomastix strix]
MLPLHIHRSIGATLSGLLEVHDIVNPSVLVDPTSQIAGIPVIQCWTCKLTTVVKRGKGTRCLGWSFKPSILQREAAKKASYKAIEYFPDSVLMAGVPQEVDKDWFRHLD